jgi:hypothetical protein
MPPSKRILPRLIPSPRDESDAVDLLNILYVIELIICVLSLIFLYLSWILYCDTHELDEKESD